MPSIEVGQTVSVRCPLDSSITVTPGAAGTCAVSVQSIESPSFPARVIGEACTFSVVAGDRVTISARGASATYTDPAFTAAEVRSVQALVSGARIFRASGRVSSPISTFNGAASSGVLGKPADILVPANFLVDGTGQIVVRVTVRKTGTDAASYFQIHCGPTNGTGDANLFGGGANVSNFSWSATGLEVVFEATFAYKSGGFGVTNRRSREGDGSASQQIGEFTGTWNNAVDNYLNFVIAGATAGNTYDLLDYDVRVFQ